MDHDILLEIIKKKINDENVLQLIKKILKANFGVYEKINIYLLDKGMPLGNLTSQFFANVYLNELDYFVKHFLKVKYYIRYVDDFVLLHSSRMQLEEWKSKIDNFLKERLKLELHPDKSKIIPLLRGVDFVGFRNFYHHKLLRARNVRAIERKIENFRKGNIGFGKILEIYQGWQAYSKWGSSYKIKEKIKRKMIEAIWDKI